MKNGAGGPGLVRGLGTWDVTLVTVGSVLGTGIFITTGDIARVLPHAGLILLVWVVGGLVTMAGALTYAELGGLFPRGQAVPLPEGALLALLGLPLAGALPDHDGRDRDHGRGLAVPRRLHAFFHQNVLLSIARGARSPSAGPAHGSPHVLPPSTSSVGKARGAERHHGGAVASIMEWGQSPGSRHRHPAAPGPLPRGRRLAAMGWA
jgi:APA family basic amino acid/polyamine antiporter